MKQTKYSADQQRNALNNIAVSPLFLASFAGKEFSANLRASVVIPIYAKLQSAGGNSFAVEDVLHTALVKLLENDATVARYAASAESEPFAYLYSCLLRWMRRELGIRGVPLELVAENGLAVVRPGYPGDGESESLTPLTQVVDSTYKVLAARTPAVKHCALKQLLWWLAKNPPQRLSYEQNDRVAAENKFPQFTPTQIAAVMNMAWGARPERKATSLMGQFLVNENFRPSDSLTVARALGRYKQLMAQSTNQYWEAMAA